MKRGHGERCTGYLSNDRQYAYCTREEHAGNLEASDTKPPSFKHKLQGKCNCGKQHGQAPFTVVKPSARSDASRKVAATYSYHDKHGRLAYQVIRYEDKDFTQRRPVDGKWVWNLTGVTPLPYRLPDLLKAPDDATVYVTEGEKDADNLADRGLVATTNSGGACNWKEDLNQYFAGRDVVILPDNDKKGKEHAEQVRDHLKGIAKDVRIVHLEGLPEKGDVSDWLAAGGTREQLEEITAPVEPGVFYSEIEEEKVEWLWQNRIPRGKITILDGPPDQGKSSISLDITARVTRGDKMPDDTPGIEGAVIIVAPEDGAGDTIKPRLLAAGADVTKVIDLTTIRSRNEKGEIEERSFSLPGNLDILEKQIIKHNVVLVVFDPLMAILDHGLKAKDDQDIRQAFTPLARALQRTGCSALIIRHFNKGSSDNAILRGAGTIAIIGAARSGMMVASDPDDESKHILATPKHNLAGSNIDYLRYEIISDDAGRPHVNWLGASNLTMSDLLSTAMPSASRQEVLQVLKKAKDDNEEPLGPRDIVEASTLSYDQVRKLLSRMLKDGEIESPARGKYTLSQNPPSQASQSSQTSQSASRSGSTIVTAEKEATQTNQDCHNPDTASEDTSPQNCDACDACDTHSAVTNNNGTVTTNYERPPVPTEESESLVVRTPKTIQEVAREYAEADAARDREMVRQAYEQRAARLERKRLREEAASL